MKFRIRPQSARRGSGGPELARQISKSESLVQAIELGQRAATPQVTGEALPLAASQAALEEAAKSWISAT
jgi:hypothetical protein